MRRSQRLIAAAVLISLSGVLAGCVGQPEQLGIRPTAGFSRHQEKAAGRTQAGIPRRRAGPRTGRAEGIVQGLGAGTDRSAERPAAAAAAPPPGAPKSKHAKSKGNPPARGRRLPDAAAAEDGSAAAAPPGSQAQENRAPAHHRAAAGSADGAAGAFRSTGAAAATIRRAIPGADAERYLHALDFGFHPIEARHDSMIRGYVTADKSAQSA